MSNIQKINNSIKKKYHLLVQNGDGSGFWEKKEDSNKPKEEQTTIELITKHSEIKYPYLKLIFKGVLFAKIPITEYTDIENIISYLKSIL